MAERTYAERLQRVREIARRQEAEQNLRNVCEEMAIWREVVVRLGDSSDPGLPCWCPGGTHRDSVGHTDLCEQIRAMVVL